MSGNCEDASDPKDGPDPEDHFAPLPEGWELNPEANGGIEYARSCDPFDIEREYVVNPSGEVRFVDGFHKNYWYWCDPDAESIDDMQRSTWHEWGAWAGCPLRIVRRVQS